MANHQGVCYSLSDKLTVSNGDGGYGTARLDKERDSQYYNITDHEATVLEACRKMERRVVYLSYLSYPLPHWCCSFPWNPAESH